MPSAEYFLQKTIQTFGVAPTEQQHHALQLLSRFLFSPENDTLFLLKGYAGTGKSSLIGALVKTLNLFEQKTILLAPTGRAAKVFSKYSQQNAYTIHKKIYRQKQFSDQNKASFSMTRNLHKNTLFVVDEASMISNQPADNASFGSGYLLDDLIHYIYSGENCRLLLIGDTAQLPPVNEEYSPALERSTLEGYGLQVEEYTLTEVIRQTLLSGILHNATTIRSKLFGEDTNTFPKLQIENFPDIICITGEEFLDELHSAYSRDGEEETIIITRSNKNANAYNMGIRSQILFREEKLSSGDLIQVVKNNYYSHNNGSNNQDDKSDFIANGEIFEVLRVKKHQELYGFFFCDALLRHLDYNTEIETKILLDTLQSPTAALSPQKQQELFENVLEDYAELPKKQKYQKLKENPYFNALQAKYAYALTCHKAQGGEWKNVFLHIGYIHQEHIDSNFYRWLYTAITRATDKLFLINPPKEFI